MSITLVVVRPFATHAKGDVLTDAASISQILAGENAACAVRVASNVNPPVTGPAS